MNRYRDIDGAEMKLIPSGEFLMGSRYEQPVHTVWLASFWIDCRQVTNRQYKKFCSTTAHARPQNPVAGYLDEYPDHPAVNVSWDDAVTFARWVGGRLPTEAEWEKASRGGIVQAIYPWGDEEPDEIDVANFKDYRGRFSAQRIAFDSMGRGPLPCGTYPANGYGLYDMAGNVWDWVYDWYDPDYYHYSPMSMPTGPETGTTRVRRGGDWQRSALSVRCACRSSMPPDSKTFRMGFRVVMDGSNG